MPKRGLTNYKHIQLKAQLKHSNQVKTAALATRTTSCQSETFISYFCKRNRYEIMEKSVGAFCSISSRLFQV